MTYLTANQALALICQGKLQPSSLLRISLERIQRRENELRAWQSLAIETAQAQALRMDHYNRGGPQGTGKHRISYLLWIVDSLRRASH